jgi:hypothetical protein
MEFNGSENRIRALFCELAVQDEGKAPRFEGVWRRAEATASISRSTVVGSRWPLVNTTSIPHSLRLAIGLSLIMTVVILTAFSIDFWFRDTRSSEPQRQLATDLSVGDTSRHWVSFTLPRPRFHKAPSRRSKSNTRDSIVQKAAAISSWQSPTKTFLESSTDTVLKSLPQLNQSVKEMESFLPNNEVKESKQ